MAIDDYYDDNFLNDDASPNGERLSGVSAAEVLTRVELDLAYSSEKALNLEILLMQVADRAGDYEALTMGNEDSTTESVAKAFEFNILSGIVNSEVKELDSFMASLQMNIVDAGQKLSHRVHSEEFSTEIEEKLHDAEESLKQSQDLVAEIRTQSAKFETTLAFGTGADEEIENGQYSPTNAKWKLQNVEQQRHILQMLEKSLARELDLEKKLSDSRCNEEELKLKLRYAEQEISSLEESMEIVFERMLEAENSAKLLLGISKELTGKLQIVQFNLNGSILREHDMRSKLEESKKKLSAEESAVEKLQTGASSEALTLLEKVTALEEQLKDSDNELQLAKSLVETHREQQNKLSTELIEKENVVESLRENVLKTEDRAESAEAKCTQLTKTNLELQEQLDFLRNNGTEKADSLERKLKESETQLEHAKASVEAIEEQQSMLYSALSDMDDLIEDLKGKVSKAESRAESAESKCTLLTETNLELNEELGFLRGRIECLEASLHQVDDAKIATAKDIGIRTKFITDLVMKLALERERLQLQISALTKKNKILAEKCLKSKDKSPNNTTPTETDNGNVFSILKSPEEALTDSSATNVQVEKSAAAISVSEMSMETTVLQEDAMGGTSKLETVRTIEATQLNSKYLFTAILVLLASVGVVYLFQLEKV